jgi:hypothetical protein
MLALTNNLLVFSNILFQNFINSNFLNVYLFKKFIILKYIAQIKQNSKIIKMFAYLSKKVSDYFY